MKLPLLYLLLLPAFFVSTQKNERKGMELVSDYFDERGIRVAIIFACTLEESMDMLKLLMKNRTVTSKYYYFEMGPLYINMTMAQYDKIGFYLNFSCEFGRYMFSKTSEKLMFNERNVWVLVSDYKNIIYELGKYNLQLDTDMLVGVITENYSSNFNEIMLYDIYKIRTNSSIIAIEAGYWNKVSRLNIILEGTKTSRRSDFQGITIKGTGVLTDLVVNETEGSFPLIMDISYESHLDILNRFAFTMNMNLAKMYNFTMDVTFADDWGVGRPDPDGLFDGMLGEIERGRSELGLSTVIMNTTLMDIMDFSFPIWKFRPIFIFRNPRTFGTYHALLIPFTLDVWIFIVTLEVLIVIILTFMKKINVSGVSSSDDSKSFDRTWSENFVIIIGAFSAQGLSSCSGRLSERIILLMSLLVGMLLCTFYNSMVVTSLLMPPPPSIQTCEQLLESHLKIGITNITYYVKYFEMSNDELSKEFYKVALLDDSFIGPEQGMYLVKNTEFAFYGEEATLYPIVTDTFSNKEICRLVELELISPYYLPCPYKKRSPLKQFINSGLHLMRERGIVMRERKRWHREKPVCQGREDIPSIQLQTLIVAYIILLCGICLSLIIFTAEIFIYKRDNVNNHNNKKRRRNRMNEIIENYKY